MYEVAMDKRDKLSRVVSAAEKKSEQAARQAEKAARRVEKLASKASRHAENLDRLASHLDALEVWTRGESQTRQPRFTRDQIAKAAVRVADAEGFAALSMRRLAAELEAGTMTLYHYIRTKDELLTLVTDAVMGEVVVPDDEPLPADWKAAITVIARRTKQALLGHPWMLEISDDPPIGPNSVRHFDQTLEAVASLDLGLAEKLDIVTAVDEYVFGHCFHARESQQIDFADDMKDYVNGLVASGEYPQLAALADHHGYDELWEIVGTSMHDASRFDRNLARLLQGIEADLPPNP